MIPRRTLVTGGVLGGVLGALAAEDGASATSAQAASADVNDEMVAKIVLAIGGLRSEIQNLTAFNDITPVRDVQKVFLRSNGKFPDYLDVGTDIWFEIHDWHVRWLQPMTLGRDVQGRYTIVLNQTVVVMRPDAASNFIGIPYDNR